MVDVCVCVCNSYSEEHPVRGASTRPSRPYPVKYTVYEDEGVNKQINAFCQIVVVSGLSAIYCLIV